jgi:hypothetical protein
VRRRGRGRDPQRSGDGGLSRSKLRCASGRTSASFDSAESCERARAAAVAQGWLASTEAQSRAQETVLRTLAAAGRGKDWDILYRIRALRPPVVVRC